MRFGEQIATVHYSLLLLLLFPEEPALRQWPDIPKNDSLWGTIATSFSAAMDTHNIHTHVEQEREEAKKLTTKGERMKQRKAIRRKN